MTMKDYIEETELLENKEALNELTNGKGEDE